MENLMDTAETQLSDSTTKVNSAMNATTLISDELTENVPGEVISDTVEKDAEMEKLHGHYLDLINGSAIYYPVSYTFQGKLGAGRQGQVFLSLRQGGRGSLTRHAIKIFDPSIYLNTSRYWTDMGRIASQLSVLQNAVSPHLCTLESYDEVNGIGYVQMEVVKGFDLRTLLDGKDFNLIRDHSTLEEWEKFNRSFYRISDNRVCIQPGVAIYILRMMLKGLEVLHELGFLHADIKPANVMINKLGYVKLIDFGRAVKTSEKSRILFGSPLYMAPEIHRRKAASVRSDIYSVGLVGLEMLRGKTLVDPGTTTESELLEIKLALHENLEDYLPAHILENTEFVRVLKKFLHPDPDQRYQNAKQAETEGEGIRVIHKQLTLTGQDADYTRLAGEFVSKYLEIKTTAKS